MEIPADVVADRGLETAVIRMAADARTMITPVRGYVFRTRSVLTPKMTETVTAAISVA